MTALAADSALTALVPVGSIHPQAPLTVPAWPFIRMGAPSSTSLRASCTSGDEITVAVHAFAKPRMQGGQEVETAEDHVHRIGAAIVAAVGRHRLPIAGGTARVRWSGSTIVPDGVDPDAFHAVCNFTVRCAT